VTKTPKRFLLTRGMATGFGVAGKKRRKIGLKLFSDYALCIDETEYLVLSLTSTYSLETAPT